MVAKISEFLKIDPYLVPFKKDLELRANLFSAKISELLNGNQNIVDFASGYVYFGIHKTSGGWIYREWAPAAEKMYFTGDFNDWNTQSHPMTRLENGVFEIFIKGEKNLKFGQKVQAIVVHNGETLRRIPTYATRVVQDPLNYSWCAELENTFEEFNWTDSDFLPEKTPFIYECHIGMSGEEGKVSTYHEFTKNILPRIKNSRPRKPIFLRWSNLRVINSHYTVGGLIVNRRTKQWGEAACRLSLARRRKRPRRGINCEPTLRSESRGQTCLHYAEPRGGKDPEGGLIVNCFAEPRGGKEIFL